MSKYSIVEIQGGDEAAWDSFIAAAYGGTVYHTASYHRVLAQVTDASAVLLAVTSGSEIVGGIPLLIQNSAAGNFVNNRLLLHYNGLALAPRLAIGADNASSYSSERVGVTQALVSNVSSRGFGSTVLHQEGINFDLRPFHAAGWRSTPTYTYVMPLDPSAGADISNRLKLADKNIRRLVRKAGESGVTVTSDLETTELYRLHTTTAGRKGAPVYLPFDRFDRFIRQLHELGICKVFQARLADGTIVAAEVVMVGPGKDSHAVCAAADSRHQSIGVNPFLRFEVFSQLQAQGAKYNDLTNASLDSVGRFKAELGAELQMNCAVSSPLTSKFKLNALRHRVIDAIRDVPGRILPRGTGSEERQNSAAAVIANKSQSKEGK